MISALFMIKQQFLNNDRICKSMVFGVKSLSINLNIFYFFYFS